MDVFSKRAQNKSTGKAGYYPQCGNFWDYKLCPKAGGKKIKCSGCENRKWSKLMLAHILIRSLPAESLRAIRI